MRFIHKFFAAILSIGLLVGTAGYFVAVESQRALTEMIAHESMDVAADLIYEIDKSIFDRIGFLRIYAKDKMLAMEAEQSSKLFAKHPNLYDDIDAIDKEWKEKRNTPFILNVLSSPLSTEFARTIASFEVEYGYRVFTEMYLTNQYGVVIASSERTSDYLQADEAWYQQALAEEEFWVGQVEYDESSDSIGADIVLNLHDDGGKHVGQLKAVLNIADVVRILHEDRPNAHYHSRDGKLVSSRGEIFYSSEKNAPMRYVPETILSGFESNVESTGYFIGIGDTEEEGNELFAIAKSIGYQDFKGLGWQLIVEHELDDILAPVIAVRSKIQYILVFAFLMIALLGIALARTLSRPLNQLTKASAAIGRGQLETRADIKSKDELGMLASTINNMAENLQRSTVSKSYLDNIIESMMDSLIVLSPQGVIEKVNRTTLELLSYEEQELLGQPIGTIFAEAEAEADDEELFLKGNGVEELIRLDSVRNIEKSYLTKDGQKISVLFSSAVMHGESGSIEGLVCAALDITERKQAELKLHETTIDLSERIKELHCLFAMAQVIETPDLDEFELCHRAVRIIPQGWKHPEITCARITLDGKPFKSRDFEPTPWCQSTHIRVNNVTLGMVEVFYLEPRPTRDDGPFTNEERVLLNHLAAQLGDTLEKIAADRTVHDSEEQKRLLLESTSDGIYAIDLEGLCTICNPAAAHMLGYESPEQVIGKNAHTLFHHTLPDGGDYLQEKCTMQKGYEEEVLLDNEIFWRQDGTPIAVECRVAPMKLKGETVGSVVSFTDMTERRNIELQLRQAQKLESIGQLAAGIAHEINTPTQFVNDNTTFLSEAFRDYQELMEALERIRHAASEGKVSESMLKAVDELAEEKDIEFLREEIPQAIKQSQEGLERIAKIVRSMKEFSHPGVDEKTPIDINTAIETTINVSRNEWKYHCNLEIDFEPNIPPVPCLPGEINQVFLNLIINASHAIADVVGNSGEMGLIRITTRQDGEWVEIAISDTGCGISEEFQKRIFDPFYTTKEVGKGTGQGLAISWSVVVDKHGGTIALDSKPGEGATFTIRLPITMDQNIQESGS